MASIFRAIHVGLDQPVAVKVISAAILELPGIVPRFMREARAATRLKGEHVVRVFDVGTTDDGAPYMVMELLEGKDLGVVIDDGFRPSIHEAIDYILQACEALAEVHGLGIVHRDLKPPNLFVTRGPDGLACLKLIDFGISRVDSPLNPHDSVGLTSADVVMGSPGYMPPEQMESASAADSRSDIWSLGAIAYELLIGHAPFDGDSLYDIYTAVIHSPPPRPSLARPDIPKELDDILLKCLRVDPAERYADVAQLAFALAQLGNEKAAERAARVARVFEASRQRGQGDTSLASEPPSASCQYSGVRRLPTGPIFSTPAARRRRVVAVTAAIAAALSLVGVGISAHPPNTKDAKDVVTRIAPNVHINTAAAAARTEAHEALLQAPQPKEPAVIVAQAAAPSVVVAAPAVMPTAWRTHPASTPASQRNAPVGSTTSPASDAKGEGLAAPGVRPSRSEVAVVGSDLPPENSAPPREPTDDRTLFEERK
jgi:serine/threonine-protein kinase